MGVSGRRKPRTPQVDLAKLHFTELRDVEVRLGGMATKIKTAIRLFDKIIIVTESGHVACIVEGKIRPVEGGIRQSIERLVKSPGKKIEFFEG